MHAHIHKETVEKGKRKRDIIAFDIGAASESGNLPVWACATVFSTY
jgi:hypothetical protein